MDAHLLPLMPLELRLNIAGVVFPAPEGIGVFEDTGIREDQILLIFFVTRELRVEILDHDILGSAGAAGIKHTGGNQRADHKDDPENPEIDPNLLGRTRSVVTPPVECHLFLLFEQT